MSGWLRNSITASTGRSELGNNGNEKSTTDFIAVSFFLCGHCGMRSLHAGKKYPLAVPGRSRRGRLVFEIRLHTYDNPSFLYGLSVSYISGTLCICFKTRQGVHPRAITCPTASNLVTSANVGSNAAMCPVVPDLATLSRWVPTLSRVQWLWITPLC
jgi:hypothetical protein